MIKSTLLVPRKQAIIGKYVANNADVRVKETVIDPEMETILTYIDWFNRLWLPGDRESFTVKTPDDDRYNSNELATWLPENFVGLLMPMSVSVTNSVGVYQVNFKNIDGLNPETGILNVPFNKDRVVDACKKLAKWAGKKYSPSTSYKPCLSLAEANLITYDVEVVEIGEDVKEKSHYEIVKSEAEGEETVSYKKTPYVRSEASIPVDCTVKMVDLYESEEYPYLVNSVVKKLLDDFVTFK